MRRGLAWVAERRYACQAAKKSAVDLTTGGCVYVCCIGACLIRLTTFSSGNFSTVYSLVYQLREWRDHHLVGGIQGSNCTTCRL